ncbi:hypothetical protein [Gorillibacterium sp. sgz5001074]|uniref:hypothetical protein n=1 Tax=Gorillibacterium sp. sgz5001074 TaxID=3446695 RepID=UPI003F666E1B
MHIFAGFESSEYLEIAIEELITQGVEEHGITVIPLSSQGGSDVHILDNLNHSDGISLSDGMAAWAMAGMLLGVIYGSQVLVGPVALGILGAVAGAGIGYLLDRRKIKRRPGLRSRNDLDFLLVIRCRDDSEMRKAESICTLQKAAFLGEHRSAPQRKPPEKPTPDRLHETADEAS